MNIAQNISELENSLIERTKQECDTDFFRFLAPGVAGAGKYGDYRNCDAAPITVDSLFRHLNSIQDEVM